ncbi:MAG: hypothetical protein NTV51_25100 [Verrucomicrobia bacterium]|nr:hypothetical protein [Verrucomicrobiota bacterium]
MKFWRELRVAIAALLVTGIACAPARALVTFNDSHDHVFVTGSFGVTRDSNVFANRDSDGDFVYSSTVVAEYTRRAGWIGVNASMTVTASKFGKLRSEDFSNPSYAMELTKQSGRTTGSLTLSAARESRADSAVNIRASSWSYNAGLSFKYPVIKRFTVAGSFGYSGRRYIDEVQFANLSTYTAAADLFYLLSNERDLVAGYRFRESETSVNTSTTDHAVTGGVSGRIIKGINGSVRVGYQVRTPHGKTDSAEYRAVTASGSASYVVNYANWNAALNYTLNEHFRASLTYAWFKNWSTVSFADFVRDTWGLTVTSRW